MQTDEDVRDRQTRAGTNQALFREVNERVKDVNDHFHAFTSLSDWLCECANDMCTQRIEMAGEQYEQVRAAGDRFFVAPSDEHVWADVERVIERHENYWVVEKIELAAKVAKDSDPRSDGPLTLRT
jgi:hypothetical protein